MESLFRYTAPPTKCGYLPDQLWSLEYEMVADLSAAEYMEKLDQGWRRFGCTLFRPRCTHCQACQPIRIDVERFQANRSQRRAFQTNFKELDVYIGRPSVTQDRLDLYDNYHQFQTELKAWPEHPANDVSNYFESFVNNPPFTEEWSYFLKGKLIGVGYADRLANAMSAIYFFYDPEERHRSLGTFNVMCMLDDCDSHQLSHLYLGYYVEGCRSLQYKSKFLPNQILDANGEWRDFLQ